MKKPADQSPKKSREVGPVRPQDLLKLPPRKALDLIIDSPAPVTLVQSLAEEDLYRLVQDIGYEEALPILALASNEQWQYMLDIDLWQRDRLDGDSVNSWLGLLLRADLDRFMIWGLREQVELVKLHFSRYISVAIREEDQSASDFGEGYFTLDDLFYIRVNKDEYYEVIREFLEGLAEHDLERFQGVLLELAGVIPADVEEDLYRLRNTRLAEKGFLPFEEAIAIYQYLDADSLLEAADEPQKVMDAEKIEHPLPVSTSLLIQDRDYFSLSLKRIGDAGLLERLQLEFAGMCNQIISADCIAVRDRDHLANVVGKACGYLSIGLEKLTKGDANRAAGLLQGHPLQQIFRAGYGLALKLQWEAKKWIKQGWFNRQSLDLHFWGSEWGDMLEGLIRKRPLFCPALLGEGGPCRDFRNLEEITRSQAALEQIKAVDGLLSALFPETLDAGSISSLHPLTYRNLILTAWARHYLGPAEGRWSLTVEEMKAFLRKIWKGSSRPYRVDDKIKEAFLEWLQARSGPAAIAGRGAAQHPLDHLFVELQEEYGSVSVDDLDPRYVKHFLVRP